MNIVYLNDKYLPINEAKISPLDRGFIYGEGIYDATGAWGGKFVGLKQHFDRITFGLDNIGVKNPFTWESWQTLHSKLLELNDQQDAGVYVQVTGGTPSNRSHTCLEDIEPTVFAMLIKFPPNFPLDRKQVKGLSIYSELDKRWKRCNIKSTSLLGNVLHNRSGVERGASEILLYNEKEELTEGSLSNVFIVLDNEIITPPLDHQKLPGITRETLLFALAKEGSFKVTGRDITIHEARNADEIWFSNSGYELVPITNLDDAPVGDGQVGEVWEKANAAYQRFKYDY